MLILKLRLFLLFHIILLSDRINFSLNSVDHFLLLFLKLVFFKFELLRISYNLFLLTVKLLVGFPFFTLPLQETDCLQWPLTYIDDKFKKILWTT